MTSLSAPVRIPWLRPLATILGIYLLPVFMLATGIIPFKWRFHVLVFLAVSTGILAFSRHYTLSMLGIEVPRLSVLAIWCIIPSLVLTGAIFLANLPHRLSATDRLPFYLFFVFISAPAQEFLYRSFLFAELAALRFPPTAIVLISSSLYSFMHIIYRDLTTMVLTFFVGLVWGIIFIRTHNFYVVTLSHAMLGAAAIMLGVV